ncbi:hypothetical protein [Arthrobacter methylotrophus]
MRSTGVPPSAPDNSQAREAVSEGILNSCGRVREIAPGAGMGA